MSQIEVTRKDKEWVRNNYPDLTFQDGTPAKLMGVLKFRAVHKNGLPEVRDEYQIEIEFSDSETSSLPQVKETGGRIKRVAEEKGITDLADLHSGSKNGILCLCSPLEEDGSFSNGFSLEEFFSEILIPFFYAQSYFEENGKWPWEHYSHGYPGLLESYASFDQRGRNLVEKCIGWLRRDPQVWDSYRRLLDRKGYIKGHWQCICGSSVIFRKCHPEALEGLRRLKQDISDFSIKI